MHIGQEQIEVRTEPEGVVRGAGHEPAPTMFVWRGRLYVVREVLDRWSAPQSWWRGGEGRADDGTTIGATSDPARSRSEDLWRVQASPGRSLEPAVFDLARRAGTSDGAGTQWALVRHETRQPVGGGRS